MKKLFTLIMVLAMIFNFSACTQDSESGSESEDVIVIKLPNGYGDTHPLNIALTEFFKPELEKRSEGKMTVELYPNSTLATEEQIYEGLRNNTYEMGIIGISFQDLIPSAAALQMPFLFKDFAQARAAMVDNDYGYQLAGDTESIGFRINGITPAGFRVITTNKKIESMEDFKGLRLRMPNIKSMVRIGELLGCAVTPMAMTEIFTGLEQNVIDGQENPPATIRANGWYEVQDYLLLSNHVFTPLFFCVNNAFYDSLTPELQSVLDQVTAETSDMVWEVMETQTQEDLKFMEDNGVEICEPSEKLRNGMIEATLPMYKELYKTCPEVEEIVSAINAL